MYAPPRLIRVVFFLPASHCSEKLNQPKSKDVLMLGTRTYQHQFLRLWKHQKPGTVKIKFSCVKYFSARLRITDSRLALHSSILSICERMTLSFSACLLQILPSIAARISSSEAFKHLVLN